jgi:hypothetical protein
VLFVLCGLTGVENAAIHRPENVCLLAWKEIVVVVPDELVKGPPHHFAESFVDDHEARRAVLDEYRMRYGIDNSVQRSNIRKQSFGLAAVGNNFLIAQTSPSWQALALPGAFVHSVYSAGGIVGIAFRNLLRVARQADPRLRAWRRSRQRSVNAALVR